MKISEISNDVCLPKVIYSEDAFKTLLSLMASVHAKTLEFMCVGSVFKDDSNNYVITKVHMCPNSKCSGSYCESGDNYDKWFFETFKTIEEKKAVRAHIHSHVNMKAFPSGTDSTQIMELYRGVKDFYIQIIVNHAMENYVAIYEQGIKYEEVPQFVQIRDAVVEFESAKKAFPYVFVEDGDAVIKNGELLLSDGITYSFKTGDYKIVSEDGRLKYDSGKISIVNSTDDIGNINKLFNDMIEKPKSVYNTYGRSGYYAGSGYYGGGYGSYTGGFQEPYSSGYPESKQPSHTQQDSQKQESKSSVADLISDPFYSAESEAEAAALVNNLKGLL